MTCRHDLSESGEKPMFQGNKRHLRLVVVLLLAALLGAACGSSSNNSDSANAANDKKAAASEGDASATPAAFKKFAMILPGPIQDADFNAKGHEALKAIGDTFGVKTAFSESVPIADVDRVARQYISDGFDIVALHTSAWITIATDLAKEFPDVEFISMNSGEAMPDQPQNLWVMGLQFYPGEYVLGYLAAKAAHGGKVAFIAGIDVPSIRAGANAAFAGARAADPNVKLAFTFTGDQNDAVKGRQAAEALISDGADVLIVHMNAAVAGVVQAIRASDGVKWAGLFTDKHALSPDNYLGSAMFDFAKAYDAMLNEIKDGTMSGAFPLVKTLSLSKIYNVDAAVATEVQDTFDKVISGAIKLEPDTGKVVIPS
jgi:basic membrane lipoprotein Med (substrate-binding protein (PBP1-ABC) superfamily)